MTEHFGFHGFFPADISGERAMECAEAAAEAAGLSRVSIEGGKWPEVLYGGRGSGSLPVRFDCEGAWHQCGMYPVSRETFKEYGAKLIGSFLMELCASLGVVLGRSFKEDHHAVVHEREIKGPVEYIDWFQYFAPAIVSLWGADHLRRGPFYRVDVLPSGACALWLRESPYDQTERESTKRGAEYLGIKLRPHFTRDSTGNLVQLNWP